MRLTRRRLVLALGTALWLAVTVLGLAMLTGHANSPGASGSVSRWPQGSDLELAEGVPTLVLFAHPRCPCTRATLGELEKIMARFRGRATVWVAFFSPTSEVDEDWERTDLWRTAAAVPGVRVFEDVDGREARRFHAATSGQTFLYDERGELLFAGGITSARGHAGDNAGREAIERYLAGARKAAGQTPVFGCPLAASRDQESL
jgi:hypothetical protein